MLLGALLWASLFPLVWGAVSDKHAKQSPLETLIEMGVVVAFLLMLAFVVALLGGFFVSVGDVWNRLKGS
ncbi:MAG TPA: hypothetical protein VF669_11850 [Tepidisphaeraceae bacterium]